MKSDERARKIARLIRMVFQSLDSHLPWTYGKEVKDTGNRAFHKKCVREYSQIIRDIADLY